MTKKQPSKTRPARKSRVGARLHGAFAALAAAAPSRTVVTNLCVALLAGGVVAGFVLGEAPLKRRVAEARSGPIRLTIGWPSVAGDPGRTWLPESTRREITAAASTKLSSDPFARESLDAARDALARTGWFTQPPTVHRKAGNEVVIEAEWRTPRAVVRWRGRDYLVAAGGELLKIEYPAGGAGPTMQVIEGTPSGPPTRTGPGNIEELAYGEPWNGGDVQAALALLRTLETRFFGTGVWGQVAGVDVSRHQQAGVLALVTDTGSRVVWGGAPGVVVPGEQSTEQKLARLARLAKGPTGRIDANERLVEIHGAHVFIDQSSGGAAPSHAPTTAQVPHGD